MNKKRITLLVVFAIILVTVFGGLYITKQKEITEITYNKFLDNVEQGKVEEVIIGTGSKLKVKLEGEQQNTYITENPRNPELKEFLLKKDIAVIEDQGTGTAGIIQAIFTLLLFVGGFWYVNKKMKSQNPKSQMALEVTDDATNPKKGILFSDVAGNEEAKESVQDLVDFIQKPEKYIRYGARMPRGVIFYGPPGTGKTLMAKAIAGEAKVPFFAVSGSDFVQMYVGVGASRVRELFKKAREAGKAVIFIDEIDALGKKRSSGGIGGNDERDQTLNALLTEMSGFNGNEGIIVIAATNRLDTLDDALLRPGRFDRQVEIGLPDVKGRHEILRVHAKNKPLDDSIDLLKLAKQTVYFSGAMLENLLNEAAIFAAKRNGKTIHWSDVDKAFYTVIAGAEKKDRSGLLEKDRKITAFHEAGHALITKLVAPQNTVSKVTIIPSTKGAGGFSMNIPPDKMYYTKKEMESQIQVSLGGRIAEEIIFGEEHITTGASNDIEKATGMIKDYVTKYGMSKKFGLLNMDVFTRGNNQSGTEKDIVEECRDHMERLYNTTREIMIENKYFLNAIAETLLIKENLTEEDLNRIMAGENVIESAQINSVEIDSIEEDVILSHLA